MTEPAGQKRWAPIAKSYLDSLDGPYHANRLAMVRRLLSDVNLSGLSCYDFGAGDGVFLEWLAEQSADARGCDIDATMVEAGRKRMQGLRVPLDLGGVSAFTSVATASMDCLFALNVLAYLEPDEEAAFYREAARILRTGGHLIVTHSNELFDLFTLNRYTKEFFERHFSFNDKTDVSSLLTHPDRPSRAGFSVRENPTSYGVKLKRLGFQEAQQEFAIPHELPPLLTPHINFDDINSRTFMDLSNWPEAERWKLMFICSVFGSRAVKIAQ